ncbi:MAG TPA: ComF family protein [Alphaproteobacteria bacterium]|nr:ComF family protein [Alphaproteobacteria bacterium]
MYRFSATILFAGRIFLDALLPPRCLNCGEDVADPGALCAECWRGLSFLESPVCSCCGHPLGHEIGPVGLCGACAAARPAFRRARAALRYEEGCRDLILRFKHADRIDAAPAFARWMKRAGAELIQDCDLVAPVPLHWRRLLQRRYNQAALLSVRIASAGGKPHAPDLLKRIRPAGGHGRLGRRARRERTAGAFAPKASWRGHLQARNILLIDDVYTTGSTVSACAEALLDAGASAVDVLTLARVVRPL